MIAVYAPLKSPHHPTPSGDRSMARAVLSALEAAGRLPALASELRLYEPLGDAARQAALADAARKEVARLRDAPGARTWRAWLTYHNYYKAPDLVGPAICAALDIPYLQIESTRARKRLEGPWQRFARAAEAASDAAHTIFHLTARDAEALRAYAPRGQQIVPLAPFLDRADLPPQAPCAGPMLAVGMLRPGDKLDSYRLIAAALARLQSADWQLDIVGGGAAQAEVAALMAPFGARVRMLGPVPPAEMDAHYARASLLLWPGVNEAFGISYLEAQAHGLPVVAQNRPGVRDVVGAGLVPPDAGAAGLAARLELLLADPSRRRAEGAAGRARVADRHLRGAAAGTLAQVLAGIGA